MPIKKNTPGCCCSFTCLIGSDDFNRADADGLGTKWVEKTGDWDISNNTLVSTTDGMLLTTYRQGLPIGTTYNYVVAVDLLDTSTSWSIVCKYIDATNYDWIELTLSGVTILPKFWRRTAGVDALIMDITTHPAGIAFPTLGLSSVRVTMCYSEIGWSIGADTTDEIWTTCNLTVATALPADVTVGFVGKTKGDFDNWEYYYHFLSKANCHGCDCYCIDPANPTNRKCIPETLVLTIHPTVAHVPCTATPADIVVTLRQAVPNGATPAVFSKRPKKFEWYSDTINMVDWAEYNIFKLECNGNGVFKLFVLKYPEGLTDPTDGGTVWYWTSGGLPTNRTDQQNDSVACTPIVIHFQTLHVGFHSTVPGGPTTHCIPATADDYECTVTE